MPTRLVITHNEDGNMHIEGPVDDMALCLWILELAKDSLKMRYAQKLMAQRKIEVPTMDLSNMGNVAPFGRK